jgi:uncharacterized protein YcaQ
MECVPIEKISPVQARRLALRAAGLNRSAGFGRGIHATRRSIEQLGYVQIDTISVVQRAHHHTLSNRVPNYQESHLYRLLDKHRSIFEYWYHAAAFLPMEDYRFYLPRMHFYRAKPSKWFNEDPKLSKLILERIEAEGPLRAKDFEDSAPDRAGKKDGWWNWKPEKKALERLFFDGRLIVSAREGFQKVYDLPERVIPEEIDTSFPQEEELFDWRLSRALRGLGLATAKEAAYLRKGWKEGINRALQRALEAGRVRAVQSSKQGPIRYVQSDDLDSLVSARVTKRVLILSPFDNLLIQRERTSSLFDFYYIIECYVPAPKRRWGYFVTPILYGDRFAGRMDAKADRKKKVLEIKDLYLEKRMTARLKARQESDFMEDLALALLKYMDRLNCEGIQLGQIHDPELKRLLPGAISAAEAQRD